MTDENGTEATRSDAPSVDDALFGDAANDKPAPVVEGEDANGKEEQDPQGSDDAAEQAEETQDAGDESASTNDLKVVVAIKGGRATIGVQRPSADPHIETFEGHDLTGLAQEVPAVTERAKARWEDTPKHAAHERPAPPARQRNRREQGAAQETTAEAETEKQQQTLTLF